MIMNTRILDMTIPTVPGIWAAAMADPRTTNPLVEQAWRDKLVREAAYFRSQHRRPCHGKELEDWLAAEREVDESLLRSRG
jgi:G3E family GTPase